jgi:mannose-1-phosphate guanylyltransferase
MKAPGYAVIIAGGRGTRFWPLSRAHRPKQLLKLFGKKSMIRETADRVLPLFGPARTLVVTVADQHAAVRKELPMLPKANFLVEPQGKNTAPCIGLAAIELLKRDPNAIMVILPADHWISHPKSFQRTIRLAVQLAEEEKGLVTIGIRPSYPETGYGYIVKGEEIKRAEKIPCYKVRGFKEKPSLETAGELLQSGSLWNSGIFAWRVSTLLELLRRFAPEISQSLERIGIKAGDRGLGKLPPKLGLMLRREYKKMPNISIDYAVLEKAGAEGRVFNLEADFGWSDVGNWAAVHGMSFRDDSGNGGVGKWLGFKSQGCLVYSRDRLVALLGMEDVFVVDTPDALLVGDMKRSQEVRELVEELERKGYKKYTTR